MPNVREIRDMHGRVTSKCVMSDDGLYRYRLERWWDHTLPAAAFVLCNPSRATAHVSDPTLRKCIGFAKRWGCGGLVIVNVCALRSTDPSQLGADYCYDPVGPDNREALRHLAHEWCAADGSEGGVTVVVAGWGGALPKRLEEHAESAVEFLREYDVDVHCLGQTKAGRPRHPLMLAYDTPLEVYVGEEAACAG